jgi:hypothetical protein
MGLKYEAKGIRVSENQDLGYQESGNQGKKPKRFLT